MSNQPNTPMTAGHVAYLVYASEKGNMHVGVMMPLWYELRREERRAWEAVAAAVRAWDEKDTVSKAEY